MEFGKIPKKNIVVVYLANWPTIWPSPEACALSVHNGVLTLPVRPHAEKSEWEFEAPEAAPAWNKEVIRKGDYLRTVKTNDSTGTVTTEVFCDFNRHTQKDQRIRC